MRRPALTLVLLAGLGLVRAEDAPAVAPSVRLPDALATGWAKHLRDNDLAGAFDLLTPADQQMLANHWHRQLARPNAFADVQIDTLLRLAKNSTAADQLLAMSQPYLALIDVPTLTKGVHDIAGFLGNAADAQAPGSGGLDYAGLRDWLKDLAT